ncbi:uncharacterized protein LOC129410507 [Boleophthalmus pectinirostris]|uniref:uncharacterized protein LOC129410507 n=1 Tax=Boleophthalmus pectinirostris TaxID=150288 RepID=UPI00242CF42A|nr:uncharacterized protein LOC129410507 [Boleophthalmus pectinirostris]
MAAAAHDELKLQRCRSISELFREFKLANLRVLLLGNSWTERALVGNLLADKYVFNEEAEPQGPVQYRVQLKEMTITIINTADMLHPDQTDDQLSRLVAEAALASNPGPHVFFLILEPETFTEQHHRWLQLALIKFNKQSFHHAFVLLSRSGQEVLESAHLQSLITECRFRYQWIKHSEDQQLNAFRRKELFTRLVQIVKENSGEHLIYDNFEGPTGSDICNVGTKVKERFTGLYETNSTSHTCTSDKIEGKIGPVVSDKNPKAKTGQESSDTSSEDRGLPLSSSVSWTK